MAEAPIVIDGAPRPVVFTNTRPGPPRPPPPPMGQQPFAVTSVTTAPSVTVFPQQQQPYRGQPLGSPGYQGYPPSYQGAASSYPQQGQFPPAPKKKGRSLLNLSYTGGTSKYNFAPKVNVNQRKKDKRGRSKTQGQSPSSSGDEKKKKGSSTSPSRWFGKKSKKDKPPKPPSSASSSMVDFYRTKDKPPGEKKKKTSMFGGKKNKPPKPPGTGKKQKQSGGQAGADRRARAAAKAAKKAKAPSTGGKKKTSSGKKKSGGSKYSGMSRMFKNAQINEQIAEQAIGHPYEWKKMRNRLRRRRHRRGHMRPRPMFHESLLGTQNEHSAHSKQVFSRLGKHYKRQRAVETNPRAFINAMMTVENKYGSIKTQPQDFIVHKRVLKAYKKRGSFPITLEHGGATDVLVGNVWPMPNDSHVESVFVPSPDKGPIILANNEVFTLKVDGFSHSGTFFNPSTSAQTSKVTLNLYDEADHSLYAKHNIPTPHVIFTVTPAETVGNPTFRVQSMSVVLDLNPPSVSRAHLGFAGHAQVQPIVEYSSPSATSAFKHESNAHVKEIHEAIVALFGSKAILVSKHDQAIPDADATVLWGRLTGTAVAYAVIKLVTAGSGDTVSLDDPDFLKKVISSDELGASVAAKIEALMATVSHVDDKGKPRQTFPTLRQLLSHTSGLPAGTHMSCEDILAMYAEATAALTGASSSETAPASQASSSSSAPASQEQTSSPDQSKVEKKGGFYEAEEASFLQSLDMMETMENPPNASFGTWTNSTEGVLIAMFLRRFVKPQRFPEEVVSRTLAGLSSAIDLTWAKDDEETLQNPYSLVECAQSKRSSLVAYVRQLTEELHTSNPNASPLAIMLANPILVPGLDIIDYIGWQAVGEPDHLIYFGGNDTPDVQSVLAFFIPSLDFWGVAISDALTTTDVSAIVDYRDLLGMVADAVGKLNLPALPTAVTTRMPGSLENAKYVKTVADLANVSGNFPFGVTFLDTFTDSSNTYLPVLKLVPLERAANVATAVVTTPQGAPITSFDIAYDSESGRYAVVRENADLGEEVVITPDSISIVGMGAYMSSEKFLNAVKSLVAAVEANAAKAANDVFGGKSLSVMSKIARSTQAARLLRSHSGRLVGSSPPSIGWNVGTALLAGAAAGVVGGVTVAGLNRAYPPRYYRRRYRPGYYPYDPYYQGYYADAIGWNVGYVPVPCNPLLDPLCPLSGFYPVGYVPPIIWPRARWRGIPYGRRGGPGWYGPWRGGGYRARPYRGGGGGGYRVPRGGRGGRRR